MLAHIFYHHQPPFTDTGTFFDVLHGGYLWWGYVEDLVLNEISPTPLLMHSKYSALSLEAVLFALIVLVQTRTEDE